MTCSVSIVIPVFNRPELLADVLQHLCDQSWPSADMQILVCDDGSTDALMPVVAQFSAQLPGLEYLRQDNRGPAAARNLGTAHASAPFVVYMDSDVIPDRDLIAGLCDALRANDDWAGAEARVEPVGGEDNLLWDAPVCHGGGVFLTAAIIYRTELIRRIGGFDETYLRAACEDVELATRVLPFGKIGFVDAAFVEHPRRRRTIAYYWKKRRDWRFVTKLALRHGFLGWPGNQTEWPRTRIAVASVVTQPLSRLVQAFRLSRTRPRSGLTAGVHAIFGSFCGIAALPEVLTVLDVEQKDYLAEHRASSKAA